MKDRTFLMPTILMINLRISRFALAILLLLVSSGGALAGTFNAILQEDGNVSLSGSESFECVPEGYSVASRAIVTLYSTPLGSVGQIIGGAESGSSSVSFNNITHNLSCQYPGNYTFRVYYSGGKWVTDNLGNKRCGMSGSPARDATVYLPIGKESTINLPIDRVTGVENINVTYNFPYTSDSCYNSGNNTNPCKGRSIFVSVGTQSVYWNNGTNGLPLSGTVNVSYDFSKITEPTVIKVFLACGGGGRTSERIVYKDPETADCKILAGKPVSVADGSVFIAETDFSMLGIVPIQFSRYHNSRQSVMRGFGQMWSHTFDARIIGFGGNTYKVLNPDGTSYYYIDNDGDKVYDPVVPRGIRSSLRKTASNTFVRTYPDGSSEEFNAGGYLTALVDRNGNRTTITRGSNNALTRITAPDGRSISATTDTSNRITRLTLPDGAAYLYTYLSGTGLLGSVTYPGGAIKRYEYVYIAGKGYYLSGVKDENGNYIEKHTYDTKGRAITSSADGTNEKLTINYLSDTQSTVTDSFGRTTTYTLDKTKGMNHVTTIIGPGCSECGQSDVSYTYDEDLNISTMTDGSGNVTVYTYDYRGNMLTKTEGYGTADQRTTTYSYEPKFNQVASIMDPKGNVTTFKYDQKGNLIVVSDPAGASTTITRNTVGQIIQVTNHQGDYATFTYDQYGNLASVSDPLGNITSYTHDVMGRPRTVMDANGKVTSFSYDQKGRLRTATDSLNQTTTVTYDPAGLLTGLTDAKGNTATFAYDAIHRLIRETNPLNKQRSYTYDSQSNLLTKTDPMGRTTTYAYDDRNRLTAINYPDGTQTIYSYDTLGNLTYAANPATVYSFAYDRLNRLISVTDSFGRKLRYAYDPNSNRTVMTDPAGAITSYAYNILDNLTTLTDPFSQAYAYGYDSLQRRTSLSLPNSVNTAYAYDSMSRLLSINSTPSPVSYTHDNVGNRTSMANSTGTHNYTYDAINRLTQATHPNMSTEQYSYDPVGNRSGTTVDAANRLLEDSIYTYAYDDNGNLTSKTEKISGITITYTYDTTDRLVQVSYPGMVAQYKYDPFGRRIEKNVNGTITRYIYDGEDVLFELDALGNVVSEYVHGPGIDEPVAMIRDGQKYFFHSDGLGSITAITDASGKVVQRYEYDAYGNITFVLDPAFVQPYTFTGREYDEETGLYYCRARYYDAKTGRFTSEDPLGFAGGDVNLMRYVGNNPVNYIDPLGLARFCCRPLSALPFVVIGVDGSLSDKSNKIIGHEHIWYKDGTNRGFGPKGEFSEGKGEFKKYKRCSEYAYDDDLLKKAQKNIEASRNYDYRFFSTNCQYWANDVRSEYWRLWFKGLR